MAEQKFTPGPWEVKEERWIVDSKNLMLGAVEDSPASRPRKESLANARLIAASPTMINYIAMRASLGDNEAVLIVQEVLGDAASKAIEEGTAS